MKHFIKSLLTALLLQMSLAVGGMNVSSSLEQCIISHDWDSMNHTVNKSVQSEDELILNSRKSIKILCFGNSFTQDAFAYVPFILKNIAPELDVTIGIAYISGCTLQQHYVNFTGKDTIADGRTWTPKEYVFYKNINAGAWVYTYSGLDNILADDDWDIVTFQQSSGYSIRDYDKYYKPYINKLHEFLLTRLGRDVSIAWNLVHSAYPDSETVLQENWCKIMENTQKVVNNTNTTIVFPYGTAIQNLRTLSFINNVGDTKFLLADTAHLQDGLGCLCAAYVNALVILKALGINDVDIIGDDININLSFVLKNKIPGTNLGESRTVVGINELNVYLAQIAATKAFEEPYKITELFEYIPNYNVSINFGGYATMYLDYSVEIPLGVEVYTANRVEGDMLILSPVAEQIPANTGVIIKGQEGTYSFTPCSEVYDTISGNLLLGTVYDTDIKPADNMVAYVLSQVDGIVGFYRAMLNDNGTFKNNANKVYMLLVDNCEASKSNSLFLDYGNYPLQCISAQSETEDNGPVVYYDLTGRRCINPRNGIYVVSGNKVLIK